MEIVFDYINHLNKGIDHAKATLTIMMRNKKYVNFKQLL